ncbi:MAG: TIGR00730 family Rossman fold protein [Betaproteobacteria bacterium]|nr:TIGR00730 family Rossman fold protein [Betaproteobacteria bacterium]
MTKISSICVFCGAQNGRSPEFRELAFEVGQLLGSRRLKLVYGGSKDGLMGATADGVLSHGGEVLGVLPKKLANRELAHQRIDKLVTVETMAQRKDVLMTESDAFLILPGGLGTLDELFEVLTANTLGFMNKPVIVLNSFGFYTGLITWLETIAQSGLSRSPGELFTVVEDVDALGRLLS